MATAKFSDLALLWPFANELDQTLFVYNLGRATKYTKMARQFHDSKAMFILSTALGGIAMDNSMPEFYLVTDPDKPKGAEYERYKRDRRERHLIYIGAGIHSQVVRKFLSKCDHKLEERLPIKDERPRSMKTLDGKKFTTDYYDTDKERVKTDYGLILLTDNPFARGTRYKALLVAGLHSYGTLLAAMFASYSDLSAEITRKIVANLHVPPHLSGTVEVIVQANIDTDGNLPDPSALDRKHILDMKLGGQSIPAIDLGKAFTISSGATSLVTIKRDTIEDSKDRFKIIFEGKLGSSQLATPMTRVTKLLFRADFNSRLQTDLDKGAIPDSLRSKFGEFEKEGISLSDNAEVSVKEKGSGWQIADESRTYLVRKEKRKLSVYLKGSDSLSREFFDHFSGRNVIVVSPHSDDSVIACGGLIYYLRNEEIWKKKGIRKKKLPRVTVLVMTSSERGVADWYLGAYCDYIELPKVSRNDMEKPTIRFSESRAEALLLDTHSLWLDLKLADEKVSKTRVATRLNGILGGDNSKGPIFLIPNFGDQHHTHKDVTKLILETVRSQGSIGSAPPLAQLKDAEIWLYESPWASLDSAIINVVIPLDKHAMFAKCQAISMHQSQVVRTEYSDIAWTHNRYNAEVLRELIFGIDDTGHKWDYVEAFSVSKWELSDYSD